MAAWPLEGITSFDRFSRVGATPNGNSSSIQAFAMPTSSLPHTIPASGRLSAHNPTPTGPLWQTSADGSRPLPFQVVASGRATGRPTGSAASHCDFNLAPSEAAPLYTGRVVAVNWQGGSIQVTDYPEVADLVTYHKSDVWVDDKKVKQLPREGDLVSFYILIDEVTKKEKADQVTVLNHHRPASLSIPQSAPSSHTWWDAPQEPDQELPMGDSGKTEAKGTSAGAPTQPENLAPSIPKAPAEQEGSCSPIPPNSTAPESKSSFVFEHCTGRVVFVSVPTGQIQIDGAPEGAPTIPYHYSDVWDDGKCVKQFPRVGDTVSCYIGIDQKTRKEKAESVKVICKRQPEDEGPARTQVRQTIQNARHRAAVNMAHATGSRPGFVAPRPAAPQYPAAGMVECANPTASEVPRPFGTPLPARMGMAFPNQGGLHSPFAFGRPQPFLPPPVNIHPIPPHSLVPHAPVPMFPSGPATLSHLGYPLRPSFHAMASPMKPLHAQYNAFAPVVPSSPHPMPPPPPSHVLPIMPTVLPMQYRDGASPMLYSVGKARSPPQSPSPSPSVGLSLSTNSSVGTLNASVSEGDPFLHPTGGDSSVHFTPSPVSHSPFEDGGPKAPDLEALACMPPEVVLEDYHCRTPMKRNSASMLNWTADDLFGTLTPEKGQRLHAAHHDTLETLLPRSPIIGELLRPSADDPQGDEPLDHDLLSGESALVAMHAVSVVDF